MVFSVKDNGIGMSPEFRSRCLTHLQENIPLRRMGIGGTGLGMAITKNIVDMLGGYDSG